MKHRTLILSAATAALIAMAGAPAMAQSYGQGAGNTHGQPSGPAPGYDHGPSSGQGPSGPDYDHGRPAYDQGQNGYDHGPDRGYDHGGRDWGHDDLRGREQQLQDWIQRGAQQGWLRGWQTRRAFSALNDIRHTDHDMRAQNGGFLRPDQKYRLNQQINGLTQFLQSAHDHRGYHN